VSSWRVRNANIVAGRGCYSVPKTLMTQDCCAPAQAAIFVTLTLLRNFAWVFL